MAGGVNLSNRQQSPIPPQNQATPDKGITETKLVTLTPAMAKYISKAGYDAANNANRMSTSRPTVTTGQNQQTVTDQLASSGVSFNPEDNPLNQYANYTYHVKWSLTSEPAAFAVSNSNPTLDGIDKTVIAESGVTAGFNIMDFEFKNICGPNSRTLNTAATEWTMTVLEPFGISLLDKIRSAAATQPVINYMRCPFFIEIWFNGYDESGNVIAPNLFYQLYRVTLTDMNVDLTEGGSKYVITGIMDGDIGKSNQIAIPSSLIAIRTSTIGQFFDLFAEKLTEQQKTINEQNFAITEYVFNVPPEIRQWTLRNNDVDKQNNRNDDMDISYSNGVMEIKLNRGMAVENIVNYVLAMCPEADKWIKGESAGGSAGSGGDLASTGLATWLMVHSKVEITGFDVYTRDYIRKVTYSLIPYKTVNSGADRPTVTILEQKNVQAAKLNYLSNNNSLKKLYQYIYTGENTEIIKFDIHVENLWSIALPQWEATNTYNNFSQGYSYAENAVGNAKIKNNYSKKQMISDLQGQLTSLQQQTSFDNRQLMERNIDQQTSIRDQIQTLENSQRSAVMFRNDVSPGAVAADAALVKSDPAAAQTVSRYMTAAQQSKALKFAEDVAALPPGQFDPLPVVLRPDNKPSEQNADQGGDSNKAIANPASYGLPSGRSFIGTILGNMFSADFFAEIELEIRGDPYWMGQSNLRENAIAESFGQDSGDSTRANYISNDHMLVLVFRSGENYNEDTGLMEFNTTSDFFNGAYAVYEVTNSFKNGSFTQTLKCNKDIFAQKLNEQISSEGRSKASSASTVISDTDRAAAAVATGTAAELISDDGRAPGPGA